ncbi:ABC transporter permease [Phytohabitans rumicis]|uniref:Sugar ABC transporter permease n=1 Tax=Phytohabitans rumicis TaxID=1076125 RepID=A0A6V8KVR5_9ACTN|nr:ABC transporter permease [Phytohabitans rumicis]GFJ86399.1 sugar ABC transporter permease [Phytohabitans rumicis]
MTQSRLNPRALAESYALLALLVVLGAFFAVLPSSRDVFLSMPNLSVLLGNQATVALLALAAIIPLVSGYFDFSLGANAATATVLCAGLMSRHGVPLALACVLCVLLGAVIGLVNGVLVTRYRLSSFVTTLAAATLLGGIIQWYTGGQTILAGISPGLVRFGSATLFGIPRVVYVVLLVAALLWYLLAQTPYGRSLYAIGANPRAATLVGIRSDRYVTVSFVLAGTIAAVVGILQLARTGSATADSGTSLLFPALAAAFLGATAVRPGFFNVIGTLIGVLFVSVAVSGLTLAGAQAWVSPVFNGAALLAAVGLSTYLGRHRGRAG